MSGLIQAKNLKRRHHSDPTAVTIVSSDDRTIACCQSPYDTALTSIFNSLVVAAVCSLTRHLPFTSIGLA